MSRQGFAVVLPERPCIGQKVLWLTNEPVGEICEVSPSEFTVRLLTGETLTHLYRIWAPCIECRLSVQFQGRAAK